jgi:hypothetical protein
MDPSGFSRCSHRRYTSLLVTYAPGVYSDVSTPREAILLHVSLTAFHMVSVSRVPCSTCIFGLQSIVSPYKSAPCSSYQQRIPLLLTLTQYQSSPLSRLMPCLISYHIILTLSRSSRSFSSRLDIMKQHQLPLVLYSL